MKLAVALAVVIGSSAFAAPTDELLKERTKKSASLSPYGGSAGSYGPAASYGASYGQPCAGAPLAPIALYLAPQGAPHYREEGMEEEHNEHARSYEGSSYGASAGAVSLTPASSGAIGYFPHSKIGPCGVPLLLSCSPTVVSGHLAQSHGYAAPAAYAAPSYKQAEKQEETTELKEAMEKSWAEAEREANNHLGHHHHHLVGVTDHHDALGEHTHNHNHELPMHNHNQHIQNHNIHNNHGII